MKKFARVISSLPKFWDWFLRGTGAKAGYRRVIDRWLLLHALIGLLGARFIRADLIDIAEAALLPLMAIFVGLTFSWAGNANSLLQSSEVVAFSKKRVGGVAEYIFTFQLSILVILVSVVCWIVPSLELPFLLGSYLSLPDFNAFAASVLYALLSLSFRTCWQAVLGANMLLLVKARLMDEAQSDPPDEKQLGV